MSAIQIIDSLIDRYSAEYRPLLHKLQIVTDAIEDHLSLNTADNANTMDKLVEFCENNDIINYSYDIISHYSTSIELQFIPGIFAMNCDANNCQSLQRHHRERDNDAIKQDSKDDQTVFWTGFHELVSQTQFLLLWLQNYL